jgi:spore coat protein CotH
MIKNILIFSLLGISYVVNAQSFYTPSNVENIEIFFAFSNWDYQLDTAKAGSEGYILADSCRINGVVFDSVGVKYKGNSSYNSNNNKNPLHIKLDYVHSKASYDNYSDIKLSNGYMDPSCIREALSYQILSQYMDCPKSNFANVYINGALRGLYSNAQSIDDRFNGDHYFSAHGSHFKCNPVGGAGPGSSGSPNLAWINADSSSYFSGYELNSNTGWNQLVTLIDTLNNYTDSLKNVMDIDRDLWMLAYNVALVNLDSYSGQFKQNYYLYFDEINHQFVPTVWDLNMSFGGFPGGQTPGSNQSNLSVVYNSTDSGHPLIVKLLANPTYKKMYLAHMKTIMNENFANGNYLTQAQSWMNTIDSDVNSDPYKFYTYTQFQNSLSTAVTGGGPGGSSVPGIQALMDARNTYLQATTEFQASAPTIAFPSYTPFVVEYNDLVTIQASIENATQAILGYRYYKTRSFQKINLYDDGLHNDGSAGDGIYANQIPALGEGIQYYIYAQNNSAGIFEPQRAEHEFLFIPYNAYSPEIGDLVINELLASNSIQKDEYAEEDDWCELYNNSNRFIQLEGLFLTNDLTQPTLWAFPAGSYIEPNGFNIIWTDDDAWQTILHTPFKLSTLGGSVYLTDGTTVLDQITYPSQSTDISYGRYPNGTGSWQLMNTTFNQSNTGAILVENMEDSQWSIYPNPSNGSTFINTGQLWVKQLTVTNAFGQRVEQIQSNFGIVEIQTSNWSSGIYLVEIMDHQGNRYTKKLVVH